MTKPCHNEAVTVERDAQPEPSQTPGAGRDGGKPETSESTGVLPTRDDPDKPTATKPKPPGTVRELEAALRALGYSRREACAVASGGFGAIHQGELVDATAEMAEALARFQSILK